jgi:hypothetical protein
MGEMKKASIVSYKAKPIYQNIFDTKTDFFLHIAKNKYENIGK